VHAQQAVLNAIFELQRVVLGDPLYKLDCFILIHVFSLPNSLAQPSANGDFLTPIVRAAVAIENALNVHETESHLCSRRR